MVLVKKFAATAVVLWSVALPALADTESVRVTKAMDDKAIVTRRNGETYLIEKGIGCISLSLYEGRWVVVTSPGMFLGIGSRLIIPDADQECRIWNSELLSSSGVTRSAPRTEPLVVPPAGAGRIDPRAVVTLQKALKLAGYDPGAADGVLGPQTQAELTEYRVAKGYPLTRDGLRQTLMALALDVTAKNPNSADAREVSLELVTLLASASDSASNTKMESAAGKPAASGCESNHWISTVSSDGELVKLEDGSIWEIDALDQIDTTLWLPTEDITVCGDRLINTENGDVAHARALK